MYIYSNESNRMAVAAAARDDALKMFTWDTMLHSRMARGAPWRLGGAWHLHTAP